MAQSAVKEQGMGQGSTPGAPGIFRGKTGYHTADQQRDDDIGRKNGDAVVEPDLEDIRNREFFGVNQEG